MMTPSLGQRPPRPYVSESGSSSLLMRKALRELLRCSSSLTALSDSISQAVSRMTPKNTQPLSATTQLQSEPPVPK
jgi:hypothetical protein